MTVEVSVYMLDYQQRRPIGLPQGAMAIAEAGRYEYSFTIEAPSDGGPIGALEYAYFRQGNNAQATKIRKDRQTMSMGDVGVIGTTAYVCVAAGFRRVDGLYHILEGRILASWEKWCGPEETEARLDAQQAQLRDYPEPPTVYGYSDPDAMASDMDTERKRLAGG
jgi:hypothetical protein